jgi:hypothetical protein
MVDPPKNDVEVHEVVIVGFVTRTEMDVKTLGEN